MKKLFNIVIASAAMLPLVSCGDSFLELTPDTAITAETFYKTTTHFEQAITAAYVPTRNIFAAPIVALPLCGNLVAIGNPKLIASDTSAMIWA